MALGINQLLQDTQSDAGNGTAVALDGVSREIAFFIETSNATVSAGAVTLEHATSTTYAGTWQAIGSAVTPVQNSVIVVQATGCFLAVRARISTAVTGGAKVTVRLAGNSAE